jgi:hypothetical protein
MGGLARARRRGDRLGLRTAIVIASALAAVGSRAALAQPAEGDAVAPAPDPKVAKKWLFAGHQLMQRGSYLAARGRPDEAKPQFEQAAVAFARAIEASDDVNIYLELATAEDKLGKLDAAVKHVRRVVDATAGIRPDVAKRAASLLEQLLTRVGLVTLTVVPAGTSITLGGAELGTSPLPEPLVLLPGTYTLSFQADGFQPREAELKVEPGSETERTVELEPIKVIVQPVKPAEPDPVVTVAPPRRASRTPLYIGAGVAGAASLGAGVLGILALREHATFTDPTSSMPDREDARTRGKRFALVGDVSLAAATAAAGFTVYWYIYRYRQDSTRLASDPAGNPVHNRMHHRAKLDAVPWVQPESAGIVLAGSF